MRRILAVLAACLLLFVSTAAPASATDWSAAYRTAARYVSNIERVPVARRTAHQRARLAYWLAAERRYATLMAAPAPAPTYHEPTLPGCVLEVLPGTNCLTYSFARGSYQASPDLPSEPVFYPAPMWNSPPLPAKSPVYVTIPGGPLPLGIAGVGGIDSALAMRGAVVFDAEYRSQRAYGGGSPQAFWDVECAILAARALAPSYGGDPSNITLIAHSFGGFIANEVIDGSFAPQGCSYAGTGYHPDQYVAVDAISDSATQVGQTFLASDYPDAIDIRTTLARSRIPVIVAWGQYDPVALIGAMNPGYVDALRAAGRNVRTVIIAGSADHSEALSDPVVTNAVLGIP